MLLLKDPQLLAQVRVYRSMEFVARRAWDGPRFMLTPSQWRRLFEIHQRRVAKVGTLFGGPPKVDADALRMPAYPGDQPKPDDAIELDRDWVRIFLRLQLHELSYAQAAPLLLPIYRRSYPIEEWVPLDSAEDRRRSRLARTARNWGGLGRIPLRDEGVAIWMFRSGEVRRNFLDAMEARHG